jgi:hypothetical protein
VLFCKSVIVSLILFIWLVSIHLCREYKYMLVHKNY